MKFDSLKLGFCRLTTALLVAACLMAGDGICQELDLFSGRGIGSSLQRELQQAERSRPTIPNINNFTKDVELSAARNPFSGLFKKPKLPTWEGFKQKSVGDLTERPNPLADLFPKRDVDRPNIFQKMNSKSKDFLDKTKGWAKRQGAVREKSNATWDNVVRDFKASEAKLREQATLPAQPSFRTAESVGEPKLRF